MDKLIVILGPTASGKSTLAIQLARKFRGEIISADSRQVYQGMDIGTGKITRAEQKLVPHHLLDVVSPKKQFSVSDFKRLAQKALTDIRKHGKLPFLVGGTAFYIYALIDNIDIPEAKPNLKLRKALDKKSLAELVIILKNLDPKRAKTIDLKNPVRIIRAIEINVVTGKSIPQIELKHSPKKDVLILGLTKSEKELKQNISQRVDEWIKRGLIKEVQNLKKSGLSFKRIESFGLEYKLVSQFLQKKISKDLMIEQIKISNYQFAKRQMTWFKRDPRIRWIKNEREASNIIKNFIK